MGERVGKIRRKGFELRKSLNARKVGRDFGNLPILRSLDLYWLRLRI